MKFVDLNSQHEELQPELGQVISRIIDESSFIRGPEVERFESAFAAAVNASHCISCANGTDALYIAQKALGAGPGDEVITTTHTWISTSETISQTGATPIFADTEPVYFTLDPRDLEAKITERTKGVIVVHLYGLPGNMPAIREICDRNGLWLIEDCAQAHLATINGQTVGTIGDIGTFSFYPGKNLGAMGDAGAIVTNRQELAEFAMLFARHGGKGDHKIEGICSRMDSLQAAILNLKLPKLAGWTDARIEAAHRYDKMLQGVPNIQTPKVRIGCKHVYHLYVIKADQRNELKTYLDQRGIPTGIHYAKPLPFYEAYSALKHKPEDFPISVSDAHRILSLPIHPHITEPEQSFVTNAIQDFYSES